MIFKDVREGRPYPDHGLSMRDWARIPPRQIRMDELVTTKKELRLDALLDEDSTFYGDLFGHAVLWQGQIYLEDGFTGRCAPRCSSAPSSMCASSIWMRCRPGPQPPRPTRHLVSRRGGRQPVSRSV